MATIAALNLTAAALSAARAEAELDQAELERWRAKAIADHEKRSAAAKKAAETRRLRKEQLPERKHPMLLLTAEQKTFVLREGINVYMKEPKGALSPVWVSPLSFWKAARYFFEKITCEEETFSAAEQRVLLDLALEHATHIFAPESHVRFRALHVMV